MALGVAILLAIFVVPAGWALPLVLAGMVVEIGETFLWLKLSRRRRPSVGVETLVGRKAVVVVACRPTGQVKLDGELWRAMCPEGADEGDPVCVVAVRGLELHVAR